MCASFQVRASRASWLRLRPMSWSRVAITPQPPLSAANTSEAHGGQVRALPLWPDFSTTQLIERIKALPSA